MEKSKGCSCSLPLSDCRTVHRDRWLTGVLHRAKHSFVFTCEMFHSWGSETEGPVESLLWRMNAAMMEEVEQIRKLWCLLCCRSLLVQSRDVLTHAVSEECGLFWAWHSQGAVYAVLSHPPRKWTARVPSRPALTDDGYSALWFTPLMSNLNKMLKMDTNSNRYSSIKHSLTWGLFIRFVLVFLKRAWPLLHTYPLCRRKRALWSADQLQWSLCWRNNLQRRMPFFLLTVENDLTFNDFVLCNQTCDNLAADKT